MSYVLLKNADTVNIDKNQVVTHTVANLPLRTILPGAPINTAIVFPSGGVIGQLKIVAGAGTVAHNLTVSVVVDPLFPVFVNRTIPISGPGTYYLPSGRNELIRNIKRITTNLDPKGTLTLSIDDWKALVAGDAETTGKVAGVVHSSVSMEGPGQNILIVQSGPAQSIAHGSITKGDTLITFTNGRTKTLTTETGVDIVGTASEDATDGMVFNINVALSSV